MIGEFLSAQKDLLAQAEERLETYLDKLEKIHQVKEELKSHTASLPDIPVVSWLSRSDQSEFYSSHLCLISVTQHQHWPRPPTLGRRSLHPLNCLVLYQLRLFPSVY